MQATQSSLALDVPSEIQPEGTIDIHHAELTPNRCNDARVRYPARVLVTEQNIVFSGGRRRVRLSTNALVDAGFGPGTPISIRPLLDNGFEVTPASPSTVAEHHISSRGYNWRRRGGFREAQLELSGRIAGPAISNDAFSRVQFTVSPARIVVRAKPDPVFHVRRKLQDSPERRAALIACSSGVDAYYAQAADFRPWWLWEYRPQERRDTVDLTESGVRTALQNVPFQTVINRDIYCESGGVREMADLVARHINTDGSPPVALMLLSLQCDDFSPAKTRQDKDRHQEDGSGTADMFVPGLNLADLARPFSLLIENVPGFADSPAAAFLRKGLRRLGYRLHEATLAAEDFGSLARRKRHYILASLAPLGAQFSFPAPTGRNTVPLRTLLASFMVPGQFERHFRDVTHTKVFQDSLSMRGRHVGFDDTLVPTILKSESHQPKDAIRFVSMEGGVTRGFLPSAEVLSYLQGVQAMDFSRVSSTIAIEQIGQSVANPMHHRILEAIRDFHRGVFDRWDRRT